LSKDSLVKGTIILTVAALAARFLGVFQRIPLIHLLGDTGMSAYGIAFNLYSMLLVVATAGIPSALSKMISERMALGRYTEASRIYRTAMLFSIGMGIVAAVALFGLSEWYAVKVSEDPQAVLATRAVAFALLIFPLIAVMRGYFQGRQRMMPNGVSQVIEQVFRLIVAVGLAYILLDVSSEWAIAGASLGGVAGGIAALAVMVYYAVKLRKEDQKLRHRTETDDQRNTHVPVLVGTSHILRSLMKLSIPIVIFSITVTLIYLIDTSSVIPLLRGEFGYDGAKELNGILSGRAQALAGLPIVLAIALSQSVVPLISSTFSQGKLAEVGHHTARVLQLAILSGLPMVLVIALGARPLNGFIFGYEQSAYGYANGHWIISLLTISAMFQIVMQTSGAVLMGLGRMKPLMLSVLYGISAKLALNFILVPWLDIYAFVVSTGICFIVMSIVNMRALRKEIKFVTLSRRRWTGLTVSTFLIVAVGFSLEQLTHAYQHLIPISGLNEGLNAVIVCGVVLALYPIMLMLTRVVTKDDVQQMPGPIRKVLGKIMRQPETAQSAER